MPETQSPTVGGPSRRWEHEVLERALIEGPSLPEARSISSREEFAEGVLAKFDAIGRLAVLSGDTDRVKDYVLESSKLPDMRAASKILDDLNKDSVLTALGDAGISDRALVYSGGGSILALCPPESTEEIANKIQRRYLEETRVATMTCVHRVVSPLELFYGLGPRKFWIEDFRAMVARHDRVLERRLIEYYGGLDDGCFFRRKNFGEIMALLAADLRRAKNEKAYVPFYEALPFAARCVCCSVRPANVVSSEPDGEELLCRVCEKRRTLGRRTVRHRWFYDFGCSVAQQVDRKEAYLSIWDAVDCKPSGQIARSMEDVALPEDMEQIAAAKGCRRPGYVAFVYADGNGAGQYVQESGRLHRYREVSTAIEKAAKEAIFGSIAQHLSVTRIAVDHQIREVHPFEILVVGGDDIALLLPADAGLPMAVTMCRKFESETERLGRRLTLSLGLVIADYHTPVAFMREVAESLLRSAKRYHLSSSERGGTLTSAIDLLVVKSGSMLSTDLESLRKSPLFHVEAGNLSLTGAPYSVDEAEALLDTLAQFASGQVSKSQLVTLASALDKGYWYSSILYLYQKARARPGAREVLASFERRWGCSPNLKDGVFPPWQQKPGRSGKSTVLRDLVELLDFVSVRPTSKEGRESALESTGGSLDKREKPNHRGIGGARGFSRGQGHIQDVEAL